MNPTKEVKKLLFKMTIENLIRVTGREGVVELVILIQEMISEVAELLKLNTLVLGV